MEVINYAVVYKAFEDWWKQNTNSSLEQFKAFAWSVFLAGYECAERQLKSKGEKEKP